MFIYHSSSNTRGILACFMIEETNAAVAQLVAKRMREAVDHAPADVRPPPCPYLPCDTTRTDTARMRCRTTC